MIFDEKFIGEKLEDAEWVYSEENSEKGFDILKNGNLLIGTYGNYNETFTDYCNWCASENYEELKEYLKERIK